MPSQEQIKFAAKRNRICEFRFHQIIDSRIKSFYQQPLPNSQQARQNVLQATDDYLNCIRNDYEQQVPESVQPMFEKFKRMAYTELQEAHHLEDYSNQILYALFRAN